MRIVKIVIFIILVVLSPKSFGQRTVTDEISYMYIIPETETIRQAVLTAIKQAQLKMIADNFGTIISESTTLSIFNLEQDVSNVKSFTYGETEVKGEWLKTIGTPSIEYSVVNNSFVINVIIKGVIREIVSTPVDLRCKILKNGVDDNCESSSFRYGDYMNLKFQTPIDGYLAVYITDGEIVQCLFPYSGLPASHMEVKADREYVLFSKEKSGDIDPLRVRRMQLGCNSDMEQNRIYVVFSTNSFSKAVDYENGALPRQLEFEDFHSWLSRIRNLDKAMNVKSFDITITQN